MDTVRPQRKEILNDTFNHLKDSHDESYKFGYNQACDDWEKYLKGMWVVEPDEKIKADFNDRL